MDIKSEVVRCGFRKWAMSVGENAEVIVEFGSDPNYGTIQLHDASIQDLRNLGEMFLSVAHKLTMNASKEKAKGA